MYLQRADLTQVLLGAAFLGSGGGGSMKAGGIFIDYIFDHVEQVELLGPRFTPAEKNWPACIVCDIGSITQLDPQQAKALLYAFETLSSAFSDKPHAIKAVFPIETGPENMLAPFVIAAKYNIPVIDGDGAGRAVPTIPLTTFALGDVDRSVPVAVANGVKDTLLVSTEKYESLLRSIAHIDVFSNSASLALWPDKLINLYRHCVPGTVTKALHCGRLLQGIRERNKKLIKESMAEVNKTRGRLLIKGKVIFKNNAEKGGFNFTTTKIQSEHDDEIITVLSQNENLIAYSNRSFAPLVIAPDSLCYLSSEFYPLTNAEILGKETGDVQPFQHVLLFCIAPSKKLLDTRIQEGFHGLLQELGYSGNMNVQQKGMRPLGTLLTQVK